MPFNLLKHGLKPISRHDRIGEVLRFGLFGVINTAVCYGAYLALMNLLGFQLAFAVCYGAGIVISYALNAHFVFRRRLSWRTFIRYPLVYLGTYLFSAAVLQVLASVLLWDKRWAALAAIVISIPVSFVLNRVALVRSGNSRSDPQ